MTDLSWINAVVSLGSGGGGTGGDGVTDYNLLNNKPVTNISGSPVIINSLSTGIYNIDGTWAITPDDKPRETRKDDMFYVLNENGVCKLTWISAGEIYTYSSDNNGSADSIVEDRVTKESDAKGQGDSDDFVGSFSDPVSGDDPLDYVGVF